MIHQSCYEPTPLLFFFFGPVQTWKQKIFFSLTFFFTFSDLSVETDISPTQKKKKNKTLISELCK